MPLHHPPWGIRHIPVTIFCAKGAGNFKEKPLIETKMDPDIPRSSFAVIYRSK
jgi:hypothetical protein